MSTLTVSAAPATLNGGAGDDSITAPSGALTFGGEGNDTIVGLPDETVNFIEGGPGDDLLDGDPVEGSPFLAFAMYTTATSGVQVSLAVQAPQAVGGAAGVDTIRNFNGLIGSAFNDTLTGDSHYSRLQGGDGDDRLVAGSGPAEFVGGLGDDVFVGGPGGDYALYGYDARTGFFALSGPLRIDLGLSGPQDVGAGQGRDAFISVEGVAGGDYGDTLTGTAADNSLDGKGGDDSLMGLDGADILYGFGGNDVLMGGAGNDSLREFDGRDYLRGEAGDDTISDLFGVDDIHGNTGDDSVTAGEGADTIRGGQGDDVLKGDDGADWLAGDRGSDTLTGGAGADVFHAWSGAGLDRVTDFSAAEGDRVQLLPGEAPTLSQVGADTVIDFGGGNQMVLAGVQLASLPPGWIFGG
jgi:Ca2+-binding RTX toxin-like protein